MKRPTYKIGQILNVEIIEHISDNQYVVSIEGRLIRTVCQLRARPETGRTLQVKVIKSEPLQLQQLGSNQPLGLNIEV